MRVVCVGGGPAGLYLSILMRKARPGSRVIVLERNRPEDTFGFGVVFSDATLDKLGEADRQTYDEITRGFAHWDDIDIHFKGQLLRSTGHGFSGLSRKTLLGILQRRAVELGVELRFEAEVRPDAQFPEADLIVIADGVNSALRAHHAAHFQPEIDWRPNRFVWLGTTFPFGAFTFYFKESRHGLFQVHAYRYEQGSSTFIVECSDETFRRTGLDPADEDATLAYCEALFAAELAGHRLQKNRSLWRSFPVIRNGRWHHENRVLLGDAAHTAHFSIGSGTKLAMEDAIALAAALEEHPDIPAALAAYERHRKPVVESTQRAAQVSLEWFESTERYLRLEPLQFAFSCLTRSLRVTHENLQRRDPAFVARVDADFAENAWRLVSPERAPDRTDTRETPPPMFTPFRLRGMVLENRVVVSPICQYSAEEKLVDD